MAISVISRTVASRPASCWRWLIGLMIVLAATGCERAADHATDAGRLPASGISGLTVVDIGCPTLTTASSCPTQPIGARLQFTRQDSGVAVVELQTADDGTFTVELPPGRYQILPSNLDGAPLPSAEPLAVDVVDGQFTQLTIQFDSGIR